MLSKTMLAGAAALALTALSAAPAMAQAITFQFTGGISQYTVLQSGLYEIGAMGANGGKSGNAGNVKHGGQGIGLWGEVELLQGEVLRILVGGGGGFDTIAPYSSGLNRSGGQSGGGGGGGSFVVTLSGEALVVAGGGGGGSASLGGNGRAPVSGASQGGAAGSGILHNTQGGGGGGGFSAQATSTFSGPHAGGGFSFIQGGAGGNRGQLLDISDNPYFCGNAACTSPNGNGGNGGFGGGGGGGGVGGEGNGGGTTDYGGGGGGGGYSGGDGSGVTSANGVGTKGGTSFLGLGVSPWRQPYTYNLGGDSANGWVTLNLLQAAPVPEVSSAALIAAGLATLALVRRRRRG